MLTRRAFRWPRAVPVLLLVEGHTLGESVPMNAEYDGSLREVLPVSRERLLDVEFFKLGERLVEKNLPVQHFVDQGFKSGTHFESPATREMFNCESERNARRRRWVSRRRKLKAVFRLVICKLRDSARL